MKLIDSQVKTAKPKDKPYKLPDGKGLHLMVYPNGSKGWRFRYKFSGKEKMISFGSYPERSLKDARRDLFHAREQVAAGIDPSEVRKAEKLTADGVALDSFEAIAREWHSMKHSKDVSPGHAKTTLARLEQKAFDWIGSRPVNEITPPELLSVLRRIDGDGTLETAHRVKSICSQIFRYAVATGRAERDPSADLRGILPSARKNHLPSITDPVEVGKLLKVIDSYNGAAVTQAALQLAPLVFVRPGELRHAEWSEIDLEAKEWNIPAGKMKAKRAHLVPLSDQAIEILRRLQPKTGKGRYVFPSARSKPGWKTERPMSDNAILAALRRMGYENTEMSGHGFRAMARTILDEVLRFKPELIEHQLAHTVKDALGRAYNRTQHIEERRVMMQAWADYLGALKAGVKETDQESKN
ncbi:MAG: integrase arm-type DNA-binding domain-containing protein [Desulfuromonadales bacterium]|nr:integrase arm-type DNA-binding domain-containing protein [Desulfuromonadales bacterium]